MAANASQSFVVNGHTPSLALFDDSHGQPNWAQTGFTSREMHTNCAGLMEALCRLGCTCAPAERDFSFPRLAQARLLVIPSPTGCYNVTKECWMPDPSALFTTDHVQDALRFVHGGGRLLTFAYRFGDWFTRSNLRELLSPLGCLLNDDAVINAQTLRDTNPLEVFFDTPRALLPLAWSVEGVATVRWRTLATFTILPGAQVQPLALSAGGSCISFDRTLRRISFASLPIAIAGTFGRGRFAAFGGPHAFETGTFGLLTAHENARFLNNVLRWLLDDAPPSLGMAPASPCSDGSLTRHNGLSMVQDADPRGGHQTITSVERVLRKTGVLKALARVKWMP